MSNKKALLVTTVSGFIPQFEMNNVLLLQEMGFEVHYAANYNTPSYGNNNDRLNGTGIIQHQIDFVRSPFSRANLKAYHQLKCLMSSTNFQLIHCHTPMGGVLARLAAHNTKTFPVVYTAHGFHFFTGAPLLNWLCYYPIEKILSYITDQQICINHEDYLRAVKKFHAKYTDYIPGAGIDLKKHDIRADFNVEAKKEELNIPLNTTIFLSSGELIKRKNHETILYAIASLKETYSNFKYIICGHGILNDYLHNLVKKLNISEYVLFLGYREDISEIYEIADIFLFPSLQEGLPMAMLEAMAHGLPIICSEIRGNSDLMKKLQTYNSFSVCTGGIMVKKANDISGYRNALEYMISHPKFISQANTENRLQAQNFRSEIVSKRMQFIYDRLCN